MNRRNFSLALTAAVIAAVVLAGGRLRQIGSRFSYSLMELRQSRAILNETQKRMDAAQKDLAAIVQAEVGYIQKRGKFATLNELVSSRDLGPEMSGRYGYVYSIHLERNGISAT